LNKLHKKSVKIAFATKIGITLSIVQKSSKKASATLVQIGVSLNATKKFAQASHWQKITGATKN
jgi:hypothetical protein